MKKFYVLMGLFFSISPLWAGDELKPESVSQAIAEYQEFWKTEKLDPSNHEVWKLYIYYSLYPTDGFGNKNPAWLVAGLTPNPKDKLYVRLQINQLYNFLQPIPQKGDVVVVEGRVLNHFSAPITGTKRNWVWSYLNFYIEGAENRPKEHFNPYPTPTLTAPVSGVITPTIGTMSISPTQGVPVK